MNKNRWLMPDGIEELLPEQAERVEFYRRELIDLFHTWGYELVMTPMVEFAESLLIGRGDDLDLQTFKLTDQLNGRLLGVRADITTQVARIDAHHLKREGPNRLCYVGSVLHTRPDGFAGTRQPLQVGAELYGHAGIESDVEVLLLMIETLGRIGIQDIFLDLGHVGVFRSLAAEASLTREQETALFDAMQRKAKPDMQSVLSDCGINELWRDRFLRLVDLNGDEAVLDDALRVFADTGQAVHRALDELRRVADALRARTSLPLHFDLAELRGYHYKTGIVFAAFIPGHGQEVARGGRYDEIGRFYGRPRPATGFSTDLKTLIHLGSNGAQEPISAIFAPHIEDPALDRTIRDLRDAGERVIVALPGQVGGARETGCNKALVLRDGKWCIETAS